MHNIYISSLAFLGNTPENIIQIAKENDFAIEFSSGMPFRVDMSEIYENAAIKRMPHNYFPAPEVPFVLNLASKDDAIRQRSVQHCIDGLKMSKKSNAPFFSAHAGFCIDPNPADLGNQLKVDIQFDVNLHKQLFVESVKLILSEAENLGVDFLIENNVITRFNLTSEGKNPLLCCEHNDIDWLFTELQNNRFGLLLDTAHLKVSCATLELDLNLEVDSIKTFIRAVHHSDNDGTTDTNMPVSQSYWFQKYMSRFKQIAHVIEVKKISINEINEQIKLLTQWMLKN
ncbi:sugar phosphate isomerase/epimerase family protein [Mucilaginibacter ginkgonis]|uniref:TIM barrel protein n=1 Tax=Mucilaginibacter ginkgonis TaxID=2682091 RepID=A0A6I4I2B6_9SPHI|nr:TIM barrel protein [Mucilaginibacter ginkgonis]QQL50836.1 TIM barrel protein [Mucilaginibacter ginkgonis]